MLSVDTTLAIILGVSECPRAPLLQPLPQCASSAQAFAQYLQGPLGLPGNRVFNLFDSKVAASEQLDQIEDWLSERTSSSVAKPPADLLIYYSGHGGFSRNDQSYFLAVQRTRGGSEGATSIRYVDLASSIKRHTGSMRRYLVLDCCFAAAAVVAMQSDIAQMVLQRVEDELPPSGTAVLCSSSAKLVSVAPPGERHTMFSGALLQCLHQGVENGPRTLTLEDVGKAARKIIQEKYPNDSVRPELHVPEQSRGDPAKVPLFPNPGWKAKTEETASEPAREASAIREPVLTQSLLDTWPGRAMLGATAGIGSVLLCLNLRYPLGLFESKAGDHDVAPVAPALALTAVLLLLALTVPSRWRWKYVLLIPAACYASWEIAWLCVYYPVYFINEGLSGNLVLIGSAGFAGLTGSLSLALMLSVAADGFSTFKKVNWRGLLLRSLPLMLWSAVATSIVPIYKISLLSVPHMVALFVPWQAWFVAVVDGTSVREERSASANWLVLSAASFALLLSILYTPLGAYFAKYRFSDSAPIYLSDLAVEYGPTTGSSRRVFLTYDVLNNIGAAMACEALLKSSNIIYVSETPIELSAAGSVQLKAEFSLPGGNVKSLEGRLTCSTRLVNYSTDWQTATLPE